MGLETDSGFVPSGRPGMTKCLQASAEVITTPPVDLLKGGEKVKVKTAGGG
ncbi:MAG TPA: hypothetical protein VFP92_05235 [Rhodanobacteraceae bacterium]|nr:hypothetical protein [Rhodanobacteraceae bacterium]